MKSPKSLPIRTGRLRLTDGTLFWHEVGQGETLLFLHGSWQDSTQWLPVMQGLGQDFHCLALDLPGFGESWGHTHADSVASLVEAIDQLLSTLRISSCYLVGHSLGAWVASGYALRFPEQVRGLVLINPEGIQPPPRLRHRWRRHRLLAGRVSPLATLARLAAPLLKSLGKAHWVYQVRGLRQQLRAYPKACQLLFQRRAVAIRTEQIDTRLEQLPCPLLLLEPETSDFVSQQLNQALAQAAPRLHRQSIPTETGEPLEQALRSFVQPIPMTC